MKKIFLVLCTVFSCIVASCISSVSALELNMTKEEVLQIAFDGNVPSELSTLTLEELSNAKVVFDSRYDSDDEVIITPRAVPSNYDYYRTYNFGVTCKGEGAAAGPMLDVNINFYINVFFKGTDCVGYENPVITGMVNNYGATGYSNPKVTVTSQTSSKIKFKGTCTLTAGARYTMSGTSTLNLP